jgi:hypothetical protein
MAGAKMTHRLPYAVGILAVDILMGCVAPGKSSYAFIGIPESESSDRGPVGMINGKPCQIKNVTAVSDMTYQQYESSKQQGRIFVEEAHGDYIYYAIKEQRDVRFDNAAAWVEVIERFRTRKP